MIKVFTECPVEYTASLLGNKWKPLILRELLSGTKRYNELTRNIPGVSAKVLTENLRELEQDGVLIRTVYPEVPPRVEYALTDKGNDLRPVIEAMKAYGMKYKIPMPEEQ